MSRAVPPLAQVSRSAAVERTTDGTAESRLALLELLSECDEMGMCARAALDWLGMNGALIAGVELEDPRIVTLAADGRGLPAPGEVLVEMDGKEHPLSRALASARAT